MSVYVDDMYAPFGRMKMCHLVADTTAELLAMAEAIGVHRRWIQYAGTMGEHFDICVSKRAEAVKCGAVEVTWMQVSCRQAVLRRGRKPCADPECWERTARKLHDAPLAEAQP